MLKPKILINSQDTVTFHHAYLRPMLDQYFDIVDYDPSARYSADKYLVMTHSGSSHTWYESLVQQGAGLIYDAFWEHHKSTELKHQYPETAHVACCKSYFWINEYYLTSNQGYNNYVPDKNYIHLALLPIRQLKPHRQQLLTALEPVLHNIIYSSVDQGRFLPNDQTESQGSFQRHFNPDWYNSTYFSIVSETVTYNRYNLHVTEKTFKPLGYYHPFVVFGQTGHLAYLHELGFETFENLFDESYDTQEDQATRLQQIINNINCFEPRPYDAVTWQKLQHNHDLFYNQSRMEHEFVAGIVNPILEYAQTR